MASKVWHGPHGSYNDARSNVVRLDDHRRLLRPCGIAHEHEPGWSAAMVYLFRMVTIRPLERLFGYTAAPASNFG